MNAGEGEGGGGGKGLTHHADNVHASVAQLGDHLHRVGLGTCNELYNRERQKECVRVLITTLRDQAPFSFRY